LTLNVGGKKRRILIDSGLDPYAASHNADVLGFDLSTCEAVIASHGHVDHAGGLNSLRKKMDPEQRIPLILHEGAFRNRAVRFSDGRVIKLPAPNKSLLSDAGYAIHERNSYSSLMDDSILITGEIPRTNDFEKGFPNHFLETNDGNLEADPLIKDDQGVVLNVKDKGLVIITGCGHAGLVNTVNYAKELTGEDRIYAIIGGMHLSGGLFEPIIGKTINELETLKPKIIIPCHCSGLKAVTEISRRMPDAFIQNSVGTTYLF
jgi:7,8-dihydropterin-6-yl-methyl-4-(beta-D-ribofuranosyl)aminobenzene 5'-phosphate synthase